MIEYSDRSEFYRFSGCFQLLDFLAGENQHGWMAPEGSGEIFCSYDANLNSIILDSRNGGLGNPRAFGKFLLAEFLEFSHYSDRLTNGNSNGFLCFSVIFHFIFSFALNRGCKVFVSSIYLDNQERLNFDANVGNSTPVG